MSAIRAVGLFLMIVLVGCASSGSGNGPQVEGDRLGFHLPDLSGELVRSTDGRFQGKVVLVTLWGSWCPPCVSEIPTFNGLMERHGPEGLEIVAIAFEKTTDPDVRRVHLRDFSREHGVGYLVLDGGSTSDFGTALPMVDDVEGLPVEILIGRDGHVADVRNGYGYSEQWAAGLETRLGGLLGQ